LIEIELAIRMAKSIDEVEMETKSSSDMDQNEDFDDESDEESVEEDDDMDEDGEEEAQNEKEYEIKFNQLKQAIEDDKFFYQNYVDIIELTRQHGDLDNLRAFREKMSEQFPLTEST
jgi:hypothetical protein